MSFGFARPALVGRRGPGITTGYMLLDPELGEPLGATNIPLLALKAGTNVPLSLLGFDPATIQNIYFKLFPATYGTSGPNLTIKLEWESDTGQTSGAVVWGIALVAVAPGSATNIETMSLSAQVTATTTVNANANALTETIITVSGASLASLAAGDVLWMQVQRVASSGSDTMTGNANLFFATVIWPLS